MEVKYSLTQPNKANILGVREKIMNILEGKPKQSAIEQEREKKSDSNITGCKIISGANTVYIVQQ